MLTGFAISLALLAVLAGTLGRMEVEVNGQHRAWRNCYKLCGLRLGNWQALPPVSGVTLKYFSSLTRDTPGTLGSLANWNNTASRNEEVVVMLSVVNSRNGFVLFTAPLAELVAARLFAQQVAAELNVPVREFLPPSLANPSCGV